MKKTILRICALLCAVVTMISMCSVFAIAAGNPTYSGGQGAMNVERKTMGADVSCMTFNVLHYNSSSVHMYGAFSFKNRFKYATEIIRGYEPDIIGIQEAGYDTRSGHECTERDVYGTYINWPYWLRYGFDGISGLSGTYNSVSSYEQSGFARPMYISSGLMIFYKKDRFQYKDGGASSFYSNATNCASPNTDDRWYQWVKLYDKEKNTTVFVINTHLSINHGSKCTACSASASTKAEVGSRLRTLEMQKLASFIKSNAANYPVFITGDFNVSLPGSYASRDTYGNAQLLTMEDESIGCTYMKPAIMTADLQTNNDRANCIDHVFINTNYLHCRKLSRIVESVEGYKGSDHVPYIAYCDYRPNATIASTTGTGTYDANARTFTDVATERQYQFNITVPSGTTVKILKDGATAETSATNKYWVTMNANRYELRFYNGGGELFHTVKATIYSSHPTDTGKRPTLQGENIINNYFANYAYHVIAEDDATSISLQATCVNYNQAKFFEDKACTTEVANGQFTNIKPGRTLYYMQHAVYSNATTVNFYDVIPVYIYRKSAENHIGTQDYANCDHKVVYVDQNIGDATGTVAFWDGTDVRLVDGQVNAFDTLQDVVSILNAKTCYSIYMAPGKYAGNTTAITTPFYLYGANYKETPNKRILEGTWELVDRGEETIIEGQIKSTLKTAWGTRPITIQGLTFTGITTEGSIFLNDGTSSNTTRVTKLNIQNNVFLGWGNRDTTADIFLNDATQKAGIVANNYFAREVGRTQTVKDSTSGHDAYYAEFMTDYPATYNRAIHMRNPNGVLVDSNRFIDYDADVLSFTSETSWNTTSAGYNVITVQDNRFENCVSTVNIIKNITSATKADVKYLGNYFLRCGYAHGIVFFNVTENGTTDTEFANCSITVQANKFYDCYRSFGIYRDDTNTSGDAANGQDIDQMTFKINHNAFWYPSEQQAQAINGVSNPTSVSQWTSSYGSYSQSVVYFRIANEAATAATASSKWNFAYNCFYTPRLKASITDTGKAAVMSSSGDYVYKNPYVDPYSRTNANYPGLYINNYMSELSGGKAKYECFDNSLIQKFIPYTTNHGCTVASSTASASTTPTTSTLPTLSGASATGFSGVYDGKEHSISVTVPTGAFVSYSYGDSAGNGYKCYSATNPTFKEVGTYTVTYRVMKPGYQPYYNSATVTITASSDARTDMADKEVTYAYGTTHTLGNFTDVRDGDTIVYTYNSQNYDAMPSFTDVGSYTVKITVTNPSYATYEDEVTLTIKPASLSAVTVSGGYEGVYDGATRTISITGLPADVVPLYSVSGGEFTSTKPTFKNVTNGAVVVTVRLANTNYTARADETFTYNITPADLNSVTVSGGYEGVYDGVSHTISIEGLPAEVTPLYSVDGGEFVTTKPSFKEPTDGPVVVIVRLSGANFVTRDVSLTYNITSLDLNAVVINGGYEDVYDGAEHTITFEGLPAEVVPLYSVSGGEFTTTKPSFKNVTNGPVTVVVRLSYPNFTTREETFIYNIMPMNLSSVIISGGYEGEYDGATHTITFEGLPTEVVPLYSVSGGEFTTTKPSFKEITGGAVTVTVRLTGANFATREQTVTFNIKPMTITGVNVVANTGLKEDGNVKTLVTVSGTKAGDTIQYALNGGAYGSVVPTVLRAGDYTVAVKVSRANSTDFVKVVTVTVAEGKQTKPNLFTLTLESTDVTTGGAGVTTFSWKLSFDVAQEQTTTVVEECDFKVLSYGLKYADTLSYLEDYLFYQKYNKENEVETLITENKVVEHPYGDFDETGVVALYAQSNMYVSDINPNKARYAVSYIRFSIDGVEYEEYSPIVIAGEDLLSTVLS